MKLLAHSKCRRRRRGAPQCHHVDCRLQWRFLHFVPAPRRGCWVGRYKANRPSMNTNSLPKWVYEESKRKGQTPSVSRDRPPSPPRPTPPPPHYRRCSYHTRAASPTLGSRPRISSFRVSSLAVAQPSPRRWQLCSVQLCTHANFHRARMSNALLPAAMPPRLRLTPAGRGMRVTTVADTSANGGREACIERRRAQRRTSG